MKNPTKYTSPDKYKLRRRAARTLRRFRAENDDMMAAGLAFVQYRRLKSLEEQL